MVRKDEEALVSVVIPCYKQAHFLPEAIKSVLAQTYSGVEAIVVDDGSPDNTSEVACRHRDVRCIRQQNQGLSGARNTGLRESRGSFVMFLDADDRLLRNAHSFRSLFPATSKRIFYRKRLKVFWLKLISASN